MSREQKNGLRPATIRQITAILRSVPPSEYWRITALAEALDPNRVDPAASGPSCGVTGAVSNR